MSLQRCGHAGVKLANNVTCSALCDSFPACLPAPSPELTARLVSLQAEREHKHASYSAAVETLMALQEALNEHERA